MHQGWGLGALEQGHRDLFHCFCPRSYKICSYPEALEPAIPQLHSHVRIPRDFSYAGPLRASGLVHLGKYGPAESDTPVEELWRTVWGGVWLSAQQRQWMFGEEGEPGVRCNLLRTDCLTWILLKCPWGQRTDLPREGSCCPGEGQVVWRMESFPAFPNA